MDSRFDVIVVGGGTAGCVVAARCSEDESARVLLIEAGPDPRPIPDVVADPARQAELLTDSPYVRTYKVSRPDRSTVQFMSGRIMGGTSSINAMSVVRPTRRDLDNWAQFGGAEWSYDALLPMMRAIETDADYPESPIHGAAGPLFAKREFRLGTSVSPPVDSFIEACADLGFPECPDMNVPEPIGVTPSPYNIRIGKRQSTATAYLESARSRPNLTIASDTIVRRLILDGHRVRGVELETAAGVDSVQGAQVVLAAGVYHSPQLLTLSGIGPPETLARLGVPVLHPLSGVGENYQDHAVVYMRYAPAVELHNEYLIPKVRVIAKSDPSLTYCDLHLFMRPLAKSAGSPPMLPLSVHLLDHRSRGRVHITSADIHVQPEVQPQLLESPKDLNAMVAGMRLVNTIVGQPRLAPFYGPRARPGPDEAFSDYARSSFIGNHGVGTCRMGPSSDPAAVVDGRLRVHGIDNLWVADASVLPVVPHANTNLSVILAGEIAAAQLR